MVLDQNPSESGQFTQAFWAVKPKAEPESEEVETTNWAETVAWDGVLLQLYSRRTQDASETTMAWADWV